MESGKEVQEGGDVCVPMADSFDVWSKPTHYHKAIIFQLKERPVRGRDQAWRRAGTYKEAGPVLGFRCDIS